MSTTPTDQVESRAKGGTPPLPVGSRLPSLTSQLGEGHQVRWRDLAGGATAAIFLQSGDHSGDLEYLRGVVESADEYRIWDGRVIVVMPGAEDHGESLGIDRSSDGEGRRPRRGPGSIALVTEPADEAEYCGVSDSEDAILIADRWGQIYHGARGATTAALPTPTELVEWFQFLSMQCPECGVIDEP